MPAAKLIRKPARLQGQREQRPSGGCASIFLQVADAAGHLISQIEIAFDDGTRLREHWNGIDRWTKFTYTRHAKIISAEIDPDHVVLLDRNFFNNSYTTTWNPTPARKLTSLWLSFNQLAAQLFAWIV